MSYNYSAFSNLHNFMELFHSDNLDGLNKRSLGCDARNREDFLSLRNFIASRQSNNEHCHEQYFSKNSIPESTGSEDGFTGKIMSSIFSSNAFMGSKILFNDFTKKTQAMSSRSKVDSLWYKDRIKSNSSAKNITILRSKDMQKMYNHGLKRL